MTFNTVQMWQHKTSGDIFLVAVTEAGDVREACGPVTREEAVYTIDDAGGFFNSESEDVEWITNNREMFVKL